MRTFLGRIMAAAMMTVFCAAPALAQPTADKTTVSLSYQVDSTTFPSGKVIISVPTTASKDTVLTASIQPVSSDPTPPGWLTVTPASGKAPLTLTIGVNPTSLAPG